SVEGSRRGLASSKRNERVRATGAGMLKPALCRLWAIGSFAFPLIQFAWVRITFPWCTRRVKARGPVKSAPVSGCVVGRQIFCAKPQWDFSPSVTSNPHR
ncbi:MAG TPA: hypothetical protein VI251_06155, partial [Pseudolabrys sp.]